MTITWFRNVYALPPYPGLAIQRGATACGWSEVTKPADANVLVTWSPWLDSSRDRIARTFRGPVIVCENGFLSPIDGVPYFSMCLEGWNGGGQWRNGHTATTQWSRKTTQRVEELHRTSYWDRCGPVAIIEQTGHPSDPRTVNKPGSAWVTKVQQALLKHDLPSVVRLKLDVSDQLPIDRWLNHVRPRGVVTWSSAVASWALLFNIPVALCGRAAWTWELCTRWLDLDQPPVFAYPRESEVLAVFNKLLWSQWNEAELSTGNPLRRLVQ